MQIYVCQTCKGRSVSLAKDKDSRCPHCGNGATAQHKGRIGLQISLGSADVIELTHEGASRREDVLA